MVEIYLLEQLVTFAKYGKLVIAAEELHITQPALSRSMRKLEDEFGVPLFQRENSKISLNETGKIAAEYAQKVLQDDQDMLDKVRFFNRSLRTVSVGSCTPYPLQKVLSILQNVFSDMVITSELATDTDLLSGLLNDYYQLAILHEEAMDDRFFCQRYLDERLYVTLQKNHPLAKKKSLSFDDLQDYTILANGNVGFWLDVCQKHIPSNKLLVQKNLDAMGELVESSSLPFFNSDRMLQEGYDLEDRISLPVSDEDAHVVYYVGCLASRKNKYEYVFNRIREDNLRDNQ